MDYSVLKALAIPEGNVIQIACGGTVLWKAAPKYTNLADPTSSDWWVDCRIGSDGTKRTGVTGNHVTNMVRLYAGDTVRVEGLNVSLNNSTCWIGLYNDLKTVTSVGFISAHTMYFSDINITENGCELVCKNLNGTYGGYIRFSGKPTNGAENIIITINEEITI